MVVKMATRQKGLGAASSGVALTYELTETNTASGPSGTSYTVTGADLGGADAGRVIVVAVSWASSGLASSTCSVAGVSASSVVSSNFDKAPTEIWVVALPTGTTGDIVLGNGDTFGTVLAVSVYALYGGFSTTAAATDTFSSNASSTVSLSVNMAKDDVVIVAVASEATSVPTTATSYSGATKDVEILGGDFGDEGQSTNGSHQAAAEESPRSIVVSNLDNDKCAGCAAVFGPE